MTKRQHAGPLVVNGAEVSKLERLKLSPTDSEQHFDEAWLQRLLQAHPRLLSIAEIEPAFELATPVCIELPTPKGYIDNFFITPSGNLVFAECKLWRNPEARRRVVAQVMDYVESLTAWTYSELEDAVRRAQQAEGRQPQRLYDVACAEQELEEAEFVDAVSRNLRVGRGLFFIAGDGIREGTESLTAQLQGHAGIHFALALLELALFQLPDNGGVLVQPRIVARTVNIERGIVRLDDDRLSVTTALQNESKSARPATLSEDNFYAQIGKRGPGLQDSLRGFLERLEPLGVNPEFRRSLILRWHAPDGTERNLGSFYPSGEFWTDVVNWRARDQGLLDITQAYLQELASATGGEVRSKPNDQDHDYQYLALDGHVPKIESILCYADAWVDAIDRFNRRATQRLEEND